MVASNGGGSVMVYGTTLEVGGGGQPNGGGFNSSFSVAAVSSGTPLANGASINVRVRFGIQQTVTHRFAVVAEGSPGPVSQLWYLRGNDLADSEVLANVPTVATTSVAIVASSAATLGGSVSADGGDPVTARGIVWSLTATNAAPALSGTGVTNVPIGSGAGAFSQSVTGLAAFSGYSFRAYATNGAGTAYGSVLTFSTTAGVPGAPTGAIATMGNGQASVSFTAPASTGGAAILSYTVTSNPGSLTATGPTSPLVVTGLQNGTSYTFAVAATNSVGTGVSSSPSVAVTPSAPSAPATVPAIIALSGLNHVYDGTAKQAIATVSPNVAVSLTYSSPPLNAGAYMVTATVTASGYTGSTSATLIIAKASQTVSLKVAAPPVVGVPTALTASASSGLPVTVAVVNGNASVGGSSLTLNDSTVVTIRATQAGNGNFAVATTDLIFGTAAASTTQTIAFVTPADRQSDAALFTLNATASSGLPVTFTLSSGPGMLSGNAVTLTGGTGTIVARASQPGNATYAAAPDVNVSFAINAVALRVLFGTVTTNASAEKAGDIAATLPANSQEGSLLVVAPGLGVNLTTDFTLNPAGAFVETVVVDFPAAAGSALELARAAAPVTLTLRGQLTNGQLNGVIEPIGLRFSANVLTAGVSTPAAGFYKSSNLATANGTTYSIVGTHNEVLVLTKIAAIATGPDHLGRRWDVQPPSDKLTGNGNNSRRR